MDHEEFTRRAGRQAKKDGVTLLSPNDFFNKTGNIVKEINERTRKNIIKERDGEIRDHNDTLYLLYAVAMGTLSSILIQSIFGGLKIFVSEEYHFFIFSLLIMISAFFLILLINPLIGILKESRHSTIFKTKQINSMKKLNEDIEKRKKFK